MRLQPPILRRGLLRLALAAALGLPWTAAWAEPEPAIAVIVAPGFNQALPLGTSLLGLIYRSKRQLWDDGTRINAVNLPAHHLLRRNFSQWLLKRSPEDLQSYWNDQYFHGVLPPTVLASEEAVIRFVAATPGAIGYVSICALDKRVQVAAQLQGPEGAAPCPR